MVAPKLTSARALTGDEPIRINQDGTARLSNPRQIADYVLPQVPAPQKGDPGTSVRLGKGLPPAALGGTGDVYIDATSGDLYSKET